jgi:hypothetical protein
MKLKKLIAPTLALALVLLLSVSCVRKNDPEPNPFGPGTINITLDVEAIPNVLYVTEAGRETSEIRATVKEDGQPVAGRTVIFSVEAGLGEFSDYSRRIAATTNSSGIATATYVSPTAGELPGDRDVMLEGQLQTNSPYYIIRAVWIRLMKPRE